MGNASSNPGPPPETDEERVAREDREAAAAIAKQEADDLAADAKAMKEYNIQQKQNELDRAKQKRDADRLLRERNDADALNERTGFKKKPLNKPLELGLPSADCSACDLTVDPTVSSSTVILTRNVLGAINVPPIPMPPSNLPRGAKYGGDWHDHGNHRHEDYATDMYGRRISLAKDGSTLYNPPYPGSSYPDVLSSASTEQDRKSVV